MFDIHFDVLNNLWEIFESKKEIDERNLQNFVTKS